MSKNKNCTSFTEGLQFISTLNLNNINPDLQLQTDCSLGYSELVLFFKEYLL